MSLLGYQQALTDLIASPGLCLQVRQDPSRLSTYDLSGRELKRLSAVVWQPGMSLSCTLHRVNRMTPLYSYLPLTCRLLGESLIMEADLFWESPPPDLQFTSETIRFADHLYARLSAGHIEDAYLSEVLDFELAINRLGASDRHGAREVVHFGHRPSQVLGELAAGRRPEQVEAGSFLIHLTKREAKVSFDVIELGAPRIT